jgi:hypothetical protein
MPLFSVGGLEQQQVPSISRKPSVQLTIKYPDPDPHQNVMDPLHCLELWVWDPGFEIRNPIKTIPDPGSRDQKGTGSRIRNTVLKLPEAVRICWVPQTA